MQIESFNTITRQRSFISFMTDVIWFKKHHMMEKITIFSFVHQARRKSKKNRNMQSLVFLGKPHTEPETKPQSQKKLHNMTPFFLGFARNTHSLFIKGFHSLRSLNCLTWQDTFLRFHPFRILLQTLSNGSRKRLKLRGNHQEFLWLFPLFTTLLKYVYYHIREIWKHLKMCGFYCNSLY